MKKGVIVGLACVNALLLAVLVIASAAPPAQAQLIGARTDYIMITSQISRDYDALWVLDIGAGKMLAFQLDRKTQRLVPMRGINLSDDFTANPRR